MLILTIISNKKKTQKNTSKNYITLICHNHLRSFMVIVENKNLVFSWFFFGGWGLFLISCITVYCTMSFNSYFTIVSINYKTQFILLVNLHSASMQRQYIDLNGYSNKLVMYMNLQPNQQTIMSNEQGVIISEIH
jgi:hypothetical protein